MSYSALFTTLFVFVTGSYSTEYCTDVANCTYQAYKRNYECNSGICEERTCYNDTKCINDWWYGPGYRCDMSTANYECVDDCVDDSQCTSGYLCSMYGSCIECLNNTDCGGGVCDGDVCVDCVENSDCAAGEYCDDIFNLCETSCNGNNTYCAILGYNTCDSSGACVNRQCYDNVDCDNLNLTNYRCDTSYFNSWRCVEKCNATNCNWYEPVCNSNGECESENCANTANVCDSRIEICNTTTGWCEKIPCESNNDCDQGWYCDDMANNCYLNCSNYNSTYCNSVLWYGIYYGFNYECNSGGECVRQECTADIDCQLKYNVSYFLCDTVTRVGEAFCTYPNCINTPDWCDHYGPNHVCNVTTGGCDTAPCSSDTVCQDYYGRGYGTGVSYPIAFCNTNSGECDTDCTQPDSPGCSSFDDFWKQTQGEDIGFEPTCSLDGNCFEAKSCTTDADCSDPYECFTYSAGLCILPCLTDDDCYGLIWVNDTGAECMEFPDGKKFCGALDRCNSDEDCKEEGDRGKKCMDNYCKRISCTTKSECESEFGSLATCYNGYCFDNECVEDTDCIEPFNACYKDIAESGISSGYQCYASCEYDNATTTDDQYCVSKFHADDDGNEIMCAKGAPGNEAITYCDIFGVNYTSCILYEYSCEMDEKCNRETGECEMITTPTPAPVNPGDNTSGVECYEVFGVITVVLIMVSWNR